MHGVAKRLLLGFVIVISALAIVSSSVFRRVDWSDQRTADR